MGFKLELVPRQPHPRVVGRDTPNAHYAKIRFNGNLTTPCQTPSVMEGQTVLPGDWVALAQSCRLGPGLYNETGNCEPGEESDVRTCMAGVLRKRETVSSKAKSGGGEKQGGRKVAWVDYSARRVRGKHIYSANARLGYT